MKISTLYQWGAAALLAGTLAACGGGSGGGTAPAAGGGGTTTPTTPSAIAAAITAAAAVPANATATTPTAAFAVVSSSGVTPVTINSPPVVNFTVIDNGAVVQGLTTSNARFMLAKLEKGSNGNPDNWVSYTYTKQTPGTTKFGTTLSTNVGSGAGGTSKLASAYQATTDSGGTLTYNDAGYYTYTFATDVKAATDPLDATKTLWDATATHRIAIQLSFTNSAGKTVYANPYLDFTIDSSGKSVEVTDSAKTRKVVDITSCNECHQKLQMHGGGRVDTQYCVTCHSSRTTDPNSGNVLDMRTMVHKLHAGKRLKAAGEDYQVWGYMDTAFDAGDIGFPQDLRNCTKCHDNTKAPQADNWKNVPTKEACLTCHATGAASAWYAKHVTSLGIYTDAATATNTDCATCHGAGKTWSAEQVHFNQIEADAAKYKMNIESATYNSTTRVVTVKYYISNPADGTAYNLTADCASATVCATNNTTKFGNVRIALAYQNLKGQPSTVTEYTSYNNGGSGINNYAYKGTNDGTNHYTLDLPAIPADSGSMVAAGTARVITYGYVGEAQLNPVTRAAVSPAAYVNVALKNDWKELALSGTLTPRRVIVSNDKCNACHGTLGTGAASNTLANAFHSGARNYVEACVLCHDPNRASGATRMTDGSDYSESYQFKRMIHGIHGGVKRTYPFTIDNWAKGPFKPDCTLVADGVTPCSDYDGNASGAENWTAEVAYPDAIEYDSQFNCNACHVNDSWKSDKGPVGTAIVSASYDPAGSRTFNTAKTAYRNPSIALFEASGACVGQTGSAAALTLNCTSVDMTKIPVISPKAATCTSCHDDLNRQSHVVLTGGGAFGKRYDFLTNTQPTVSQADFFSGVVSETCDGCHAPGTTLKPIDAAHGMQ